MEYHRINLPHPLHGSVNVFLVGHTLIDTGHAYAPCRITADELETEFSAIERIIVTHPHVDHVGGSQTVSQLAEVPHVVHKDALDKIYNFEDYLRSIRTSQAEMSENVPDASLDYFDEAYPLEEAFTETAIDVDQTVGAGDRLQIDGEDIQVIHTPGHEPAHVSLYHESSATVVAGDVVSRSARFVPGSRDFGDIGAYRESLRRLMELCPDRLLVGHGPPITDVRDHLETALRNVDETLAQVRAAVPEDGQTGAGRIVADVFGESNRKNSYFRILGRVYLEYLSRSGEVELETRQGRTTVSPSA